MLKLSISVTLKYIAIVYDIAHLFTELEYEVAPVRLSFYTGYIYSMIVSILYISYLYIHVYVRDFDIYSGVSFLKKVCIGYTMIFIPFSASNF